MLVGADLLPLRFAVFVALFPLAAALSWWVSRRVGWRPAGPLLLIALTPVIPSLPVWGGLSTDDVLPVSGAVLGLLSVDWRRRPAMGWSPPIILGAILMAVGAAIAAVANATGVVAAAQLLLRGVGHIALLALIAAAVALAAPSDRRRRFVAVAVAVVATFEAVFGLVAWVVTLPGEAGIEPTRQLTSLVGRVVGRIAGTTGLSPNFLGALFVLSLPLTVALALRSDQSRVQRSVWWVAVAAQLVALALTFTRTSLVIAIVLIGVQLLSRGRFWVLAALAAILVVVAVVTPLGSRMLGDANDRAALWTAAIRMFVDHPLAGVGPGQMLAVAATDPGRYVDTPFGPATSSAHNTVLLAAAETGIVGAVGTLLLNVALALVAIATAVVAR
ncbi:MAG TPA: O-antigen ligase family protein, partial [Candidatus Limnocylindrales bacterium]|nr:O-antigen ligase family protein [Candidatus Limnocylindrales bacterium]